MKQLLRAGLAIALLAVPAVGGATDLPAQAGVFTQAFITQTPVTGPAPALTPKQAMVVQSILVNRLSRALGSPIGYKAGLTAKAAQQALGVTEPVRGVLLSRMILPDGASVPANFGARPMIEADLLVEIGSDAINDATTPEQALKALHAVIPFIELPDLMYARGVALDGPAIAAINVGARYGVAGKPIPVNPGGDWMRRLSAFSVTLKNGAAMVGSGTGEAIMDHPLNAVLWLVRSLNRDGVRLKAGDLLSLGSLTKPVPVTGGATYTARYKRLDPSGPVAISVHIASPAR